MPWACETKRCLRENVGRSRSAERAAFLRRRTQGADRVGAVRRAGRNAASRVQLDVGRQVRRKTEGVTGGLVLFERELVGGRINLAKVVDAGIGLGLGTSFHEVRNRNRRQQADDGHDDHDFYQRETRFADVLVCFHFMSFFRLRGGTALQAGYMITIRSLDCLQQPRQ